METLAKVIPNDKVLDVVDLKDYNSVRATLPLSLPEFDLVLKENQQINIDYYEYESVAVKGIHTLEDNLFELPLSEEHESLIEAGYEIDESLNPTPIFQTILNVIERQTHTRFLLRKKVLENYILKYGEYEDFDGDTKYGWYLIDAIETALRPRFVRPLTRQFILDYMVNKSVVDTE